MKVFAYGSLIWNPGFRPVRSEAAVLEGWSRRWCVPSVVHRGTPENPGVVLGLVPGGRCTGVVHEVDPADVASVTKYLDLRELGGGDYVPELVRIRKRHGSADALAFVSSPHLARDPCRADVVRRILSASGISGSNREYARRTISWIRREASARWNPNAAWTRRR